MLYNTSIPYIFHEPLLHNDFLYSYVLQGFHQNWNSGILAGFRQNCIISPNWPEKVSFRLYSLEKERFLSLYIKLHLILASLFTFCRSCCIAHIMLQSIRINRPIQINESFNQSIIQRKIS